MERCSECQGTGVVSEYWTVNGVIVQHHKACSKGCFGIQFSVQMDPKRWSYGDDAPQALKFASNPNPSQASYE